MSKFHLTLATNVGIYEVWGFGNGTPVNFQLQNRITNVEPAFRKPKFHKYIVGGRHDLFGIKFELYKKIKMDIIAKHLDRSQLKYPIHKIETICAFHGEKITEAIKLKDLVSDVFTDWEYIKHHSGYVSINTALCIGDVVPGKTRNNSLRNYSYFASNSELIFLSRQDILELLLNIPETPFRIAVSYNNKKHTAYKTVLNTSKESFLITTDLYSVVFERIHVEKFLSVIQSWYSVIPEKATTTTQPTYFTKEEILNGNGPYHKQIVYGIDKFETENEFLKPFRNTQIFELITHLINKKQC